MRKANSRTTDKQIGETHHFDKSFKRAGKFYSETVNMKIVQLKLVENQTLKCSNVQNCPPFETNASSQALDEHLDVFPPSVKLARDAISGEDVFRAECGSTRSVKEMNENSLFPLQCSLECYRSGVLDWSFFHMAMNGRFCPSLLCKH